MKRIAIVGCGGAGKSTFAREVGERLGIEVTHLDTHFWRPGWTETPTDEWVPIHRELLKPERWILEGNFGGTQDERFALADTIVFLDVPRRVCLWRIFKRVVHYRGRSRPDLAPGCPERFDWEFTRWVWGFRSHTRPAMLERLDRFRDGRRVEILRGTRDARRFLESLG